MNKQQRNSKKEFAKSLYIYSQQTQEEISEIIGISRQTVNKWIKNGHWDELRAAITITPEKIITNLTKQLNEINKSVSERPEGERFATAKEADAILKISNTIKNLRQELGLSDVVSVGMRFFCWLKEVGEYEKGKEFSDFFNQFVNDIVSKKC